MKTLHIFPKCRVLWTWEIIFAHSLFYGHVSIICYSLQVINTSLVLFTILSEAWIQPWLQRDGAVHSRENNCLAIVFTGNRTPTHKLLSPVCRSEKFLHYAQRWWHSTVSHYYFLSVLLPHISYISRLCRIQIKNKSLQHSWLISMLKNCHDILHIFIFKTYVHETQFNVDEKL